MSISIRSFRNTDSHAICAIWNSHHAQQGLQDRIDPLKLELGCLAKPFFDVQQFLLAEIDGQPVGFLHFGILGDPSLNEFEQRFVGISSFCIQPCEQEDQIASVLLERFGELAAAQNFSHATYKPILPHCPFFLGFGPGDAMIGATSSEVRTHRWITANGFLPSVPTCQWQLNLERFQAPVDRLQIQIRRTSQVNRELDEPVLPWWQACVLGHADPSAFRLTHRAEKRVVAEVLFWTFGPELQTTPDSVVWLWPPVVPKDVASADELLFLIAESLRQFQSERIDLARTVSLADETSTTALLRRLGFTVRQSGIVFTKKL